MDKNITRRDFLDGVAKVIGGVAAISAAAGCADPALSPSNGDPVTGDLSIPLNENNYPPLRQGMRGFDNASMDAGHAVRDGMTWDAPANTGEGYDLVIVGSGMAGLSAAYFYRKQIPNAKILILEGCDDFGGHARRVEFNVDGKQLLICGGTQELWNPNTFSPESLQMLKDIGIDRERYYQHAKADKDPLENFGAGTFFAKEIFGEDKFVTGRPALSGSHAATAEQWRAYFDKTPLPEAMKEGFIRLYTNKSDFMAGVPIEEKVRRLRKMSYADYLKNVMRIDPGTVAYIVRGGSGDSDNVAAGPDSYSAWYAWRRNRIGFDGLGLPKANQVSSLTSDPGEHITFPDGNGGVARLLIRWLIPRALPGSTAEDSIVVPFRYDQLDLPENEVRIRLSSMVTRVKHLGDPQTAREVEITYLKDGKLYKVRAGATVLACFNTIIPHLAPELPETQKAALRMAVRKPLVRSFVAIRNWSAFEKLGVSEVVCPGMFHSSIFPWFRPEWGGAYKNASTSDEPVILTMILSNEILEMHGTNLSPRERWKAARAHLQTISFETIEHNIRSQLDRVLGPGGFNAGRDIAGITVCRWSHGYAGGSNELYDPDWLHRADAPWVIGRQRFGRIAISNSDAAATSLTNAAFAQSHRAVMEIINDIIRPVYDFRWSESDNSAEPG